VIIRRELHGGDRAAIEAMVRASGFFTGDEVAIALELVDDRLQLGERSHYRFLIAEDGGVAIGYAAWGPIPGTVASADLYWIAVDPRTQGRGVGRALLDAAEAWIAEQGRTRVYIETSTREQYVPTRGFYLRCGYHLAAELPDFYAPGDGKAIYVRVLEPAG
jgi:ribosomal protein S18 acetylase RimI-like enzyme